MDISLPIQRADTISVSLITDCKTEKTLFVGASPAGDAAFA
jgi:hypothetical protein